MINSCIESLNLKDWKQQNLNSVVPKRRRRKKQVTELKHPSRSNTRSLWAGDPTCSPAYVKLMLDEFPLFIFGFDGSFIYFLACELWIHWRFKCMSPKVLDSTLICFCGHQLLYHFLRYCFKLNKLTSNWYCTRSTNILSAFPTFSSFWVNKYCNRLMFTTLKLEFLCLFRFLPLLKGFLTVKYVVFDNATYVVYNTLILLQLISIFFPGCIII